ncbi:heterokaryon incompatibility 6 OR allele [Fusarium coicis]|nr:heterokaryon incompatibility 6 OR allele [Fusarium coicis]
MSPKVRWIHVFLRKKNNASNTEAQLLKLREVSDWSWYYELHEGGFVLQMKARISGAIDESLVDAGVSSSYIDAIFQKALEACHLLRPDCCNSRITICPSNGIQLKLSQRRTKAPRSKTTFRKVLWIPIGALAWGQVFISYVYEPLRDNSVLSDIAQSTIYRAIPAKLARPAERVENELYQPITGDKEIRLLILEPGSRDEALECHLVNAELAWRTRFEALSYAWGDDTIRYQLRCSGHDISIRANLHDALLDLRHPTRKRVLWIDALCINQTDGDEKSKQIRLMHEIYSQAQEVLIYLGKSDPSVQGAIESMRWLDWKFIPLYARQIHMGSHVGISSFLIERHTSIKPIDRQDFSWDPIINLLSRPWFQRTWVIQEAVIPKHAKVICGHQSISWTRFLRVVDAMKNYESSIETIPGYHLVHDTISSLDLMRLARSNRHHKIYILGQWWYRPLLTGHPMDGQGGSKLFDLILMSRRYKCTYPHDKIFGMLGVTGEDTSSELLKPDYDISPMDAYRNFVLWEMHHNRSLRVLGTSSKKTGRHRSSPSWVPNFSNLDPIEGLTGVLFSVAGSDASAGLSMEVRESDDGAMLHIKGSIVDVLDTVGKKSFTEVPPDPVDTIDETSESQSMSNFK